MRIIGAILGDGKGIGKEDEEEAQQSKPFSAGEDVLHRSRTRKDRIEGKEEEHQEGEEHQRYLASDRTLSDGDRSYYCCYPTDSEEVEDIGADDVTHSDIGIALKCRHEADDKLRSGGAEGHNC